MNKHFFGYLFLFLVLMMHTFNDEVINFGLAHSVTKATELLFLSLFFLHRGLIVFNNEKTIIGIGLWNTDLTSKQKLIFFSVCLLIFVTCNISGVFYLI